MEQNSIAAIILSEAKDIKDGKKQGFTLEQLPPAVGKLCLRIGSRGKLYFFPGFNKP
jgi:hypothetical protein